jgi:uncharacterized membrane protein
MDEDIGVLIGLLFGFGVLASWVLGVIGFFHARAARREIASLRRVVAELSTRPAAPAASVAQAPVPPEPMAAEAPPEPVPEPIVVAAEEPEPIPAAETPPVAAAPPRAARSFEELLTLRWGVWLGAGTIALGGIFLIRYAMDQGLLGPTVRTILGLIIGFGLVGGGVALRRTGLARRLAADYRPDMIPSAVSAAGVIILFGNVYAAYGLYDLIPPVVAFVGLAATAFLAIGIALLHGPVLAAIGLAGAFAVPALVSTGNSDAVALFTYLISVVGAAMGVVRYRAWAWLAWLAVGGGIAWGAIWFLFAFTPPDSGIVGLYLVALAALYIFVLPSEAHDWPVARRITWAAMTGVALLAFTLVREDSYDLPGLGALAALVGLTLLAGDRRPALDKLPWLGAGLVVATLGMWHLAQVLPRDVPIGLVEGRAAGVLPGPILPPGIEIFVLTNAVFAALIGLGGFLLMRRQPRPAIWAALPAAAPVTLLALAYVRIAEFQPALHWAIAGFALAGILVALTERAARFRADPRMELATGVLAAGAATAVAIGFGMGLSRFWLSVALAAELPALAWIATATRLDALRRLALVLAAIVLARLVVNPSVAEYDLGSLPVLNWLLYGYGVPAVAFWWAARRFAGGGRDLLVLVLEAGAFALGAMLVSLEIRHFMGNGRIDESYGFAEMVLQTNAWSAMAVGALWVDRGRNHPVLMGGAILLGVLAAWQTFSFHLLDQNPLFTGTSVGGVPIVDLLLPGYALPALWCVLAARMPQVAARPLLRRGLEGAALVLGLVWVTLVVRRVFDGPTLQGETSDPEWYAYSGVWLIYGAGLLALGIRRGSRALRYASLAVVTLTIAKVFLFDMSALTGLLRVLSFFGLGGALIGIGLLYQRFVFPPRTAAGT